MILASALEQRGLLDAKGWKQAGLQPATEPACPIWPAMPHSAIALVGYDTYTSTCVYGPAHTAPAWNEIWSELVAAWK
jgi:hypothetical protein